MEKLNPNSDKRYHSQTEFAATDENKRMLFRDAQPSVFPEWFGTLVVTFIAAAVVAGDYFMGVAYYNAYLDHFKVDKLAFAVDREEYLVYGFEALRASLSSLPDVLFRHWREFASATAGIILLSLSAVMARRLFSLGEQYRVRVQRRGGKLSGRQEWGLAIISNIVLILALATAAAGIQFTAFGLYLPSKIGEDAGGVDAAMLELDIQAGCNDEYSGTCYSLRKDEKEIIRGFKIAESKERIALFYNGVTYDYSLKDRDLATIPINGPGKH